MLNLEDATINFSNVLNGNAPLQNLDLEQSTQSPASVASLLRGLAQHPTLQSVHLGIIDCHDSFLGQLCETLRENQVLKYLSMRLRKWSVPEMEIFYRDFFACLPDFRSLRELDVNESTGHPILKTTGEILLQSLEQNTTLESVSVSLAFLPFELHDKIVFYLRLNKLGRKLLLSDSARRNTSLWPRVLAKMGAARDIRYLHYFVHALRSSALLSYR